MADIEKSLEEMRRALKDLEEKYGFSTPNRGDLDDPNIKWREGKPDYTKANYMFHTGKTQNHNGLELVVENLVKQWEMEASHKIDMDQWDTINHNDYKLQVNGMPVVDGREAAHVGNYNMLLRDCPEYKQLDIGTEDFETSHSLFRNAFPDGFPWEVLKVFSGPPFVVFTWRHWGLFKGGLVTPDEIFSPSKKTVEMFGICRVKVNTTIDANQIKIEKIEVFYDPSHFIKIMTGKIDGNVCPYAVDITGDRRKTAIEKIDSS